jgi:hypothetical protein
MGRSAVSPDVVLPPTPVRATDHLHWPATHPHTPTCTHPHRPPHMASPLVSFPDMGRGAEPVCSSGGRLLLLVWAVPLALAATNYSVGLGLGGLPTLPDKSHMVRRGCCAPRRPTLLGPLFPLASRLGSFGQVPCALRGLVAAVVAERSAPSCTASRTVVVVRYAGACRLQSRAQCASSVRLPECGGSPGVSSPQRCAGRAPVPALLCARAVQCLCLRL